MLGHVLEAPAQQALVERERRRRVLRLQLVPGQRAGDVHHRGAGVRARFPEREYRADGILDDRLATDVQHVERLEDHHPVEPGDGGGRGVDVRDRDVRHPVRRDTARPLVRRLLVQPGHVGSGQPQHRVRSRVACRKVLGLPAEEAGVEGLRAGRVGRGEIDPRERAGRIARTFRHRFPPSVA